MQNLEKQGKYVHIMTLINFRQISTYFFKKFDKLYMNRFSLNSKKFIKGGTRMETPVAEGKGVTCWSCLACAACTAFALTLVSAVSGLNTV